MPELQAGLRAALGFAQETTYGTLVAASKYLRPVALNIANNKPSFTDPQLTEDMDVAVYYGLDRSQVEVGLRENYEGHELLWHALLGTYTFSTPAAGEGLHSLAYNPAGTHDFVKGLSVWMQFGATGLTGARAINGMHVTRAVIEGTPDDFVRTTFTLVGRDILTSAAFTPTYPARLPIVGARATTCTIGEVNVKTRSWRITIDVPRDADRTHYGQQIVAEPVRVDKLRATIEAQVELNQGSNNSWELLDDVINANRNASAAIARTIDIQHATIGNISGGSNPYEFDISGKFFVQGDEPSVQDNGTILMNLRGSLVNDSSPLTVAYRNGVLAQVT